MYSLLSIEPRSIVNVVVASSNPVPTHPANVYPDLVGLFTVNVRVSTVKDVMFSVSTEPPSKLYVIVYEVGSDQFALNTKFPNVPVVIT